MADNVTESWRAYPYHSGDLTFPDDEGVHPDNPYGWWYVNLHLDDEAGKRIVVFTSFVSTVNEQLGSVADLSRGKHLDQYVTGEVTAETDHLDVQFRKGDSPPNYLRQVADEPFHYDFYYGLEGYEFDLRLESKKPPYALAEKGLVQQLSATYSYYYVQPRLAVSGTMKRDDGSSTKVTGIGWLDRQWYPTSNPGTDIYLGHFWIAIHLSDGTDISAYRCLGDGGSCPYPLFEVMGSDNRYTHYSADTIKPLELFQTPPIGQGPMKEFQFPLSVKVVHAPTGTDLTLTIAAEDPMDNALDLGPKGCFFEGGFTVTGSHESQAVSGDAFVEVSLFGAQEGPLEVPEWRMPIADLSQEQRILRESTADFFSKECPLEKVKELVEADQPYSRELWVKMVEQGYLGLLLPESIGGLAWGPMELAIVSEEMGKACLPGPFISSLWGSCAIERATTGAQRESLLAQIVKGETTLTVAFRVSSNWIQKRIAQNEKTARQMV